MGKWLKPIKKMSMKEMKKKIMEMSKQMERMCEQMWCEEKDEEEMDD